MISVKEAIKAAQDFAAEIYPPSDVRGLRVEALNEANGYWYVTLGWVETDTRVINPSNVFTPSRSEVVAAPRVYKKFKIDGMSGEVVAMSDGE